MAGDLLAATRHLHAVRPGEAGHPVKEEYFAFQHDVVGVVQSGDEGVPVGDG